MGSGTTSRSATLKGLVDGRWTGRDAIFKRNSYSNVFNRIISAIDALGLKIIIKDLDWRRRGVTRQGKYSLAITEGVEGEHFINIIQDAEFDCKCDKNGVEARVKILIEPEIIVHKFWPNAQDLSKSYTKRGVEMILEHERKRLEVYLKIDKWIKYYYSRMSAMTEKGKDCDKAVASLKKRYRSIGLETVL